MNNTKNTASHYQTGDEIHLDYFAGYYITKQIGIGVVGSYYRQVTLDRDSGVPDNTIQGEASSIDTVLLYNAKLLNHEVSFSTKRLHEYHIHI